MRLSAVFIAAALAFGPAAASASEGDSALSVSLGYGTYSIPDYRPDGTVLGLDFERGISEALSWRVSGGLGAYYGDDRFTYSGHAVAGLTYLFDVLKYVPYANLGVGGIVIGGDADGTRVSALVELGVGLEILHSRTFSYGVQLRFETFIQQTSFFTAGARMTWRWGFF